MNEPAFSAVLLDDNVSAANCVDVASGLMGDGAANVNVPPQGVISISDHFKTRGYVPGGIISNSKAEYLDIEAMPPFLRTLLVTDGTVTKTLEAYFWEGVSVGNLGQQKIELDSDIPWLGMKKGDLALRREVKLQGKESGRVYAFARSILRLDLLPNHVCEDLLVGRIGIGEMLREYGLETYREILDIGREIDESLRMVFESKQCGELVYRTYRVLMNRQPTMLITEKFPFRLFGR